MIELLLAGFLLVEADLNTELGKAVTELTGTECVTEKSFDMEAVGDTPMFSIRCKDGREFVVAVFTDGTIGVLPCEELKDVNGKCWITFKEQGDE